MKIFTADVVIYADQAAPNQCMAAFGSVNVNIATRILERPMADRFVCSCPALLEPSISRKFIGHQTGAAVNVFQDCSPQCSGCDIGHNATTKLPASLYGTKHRSLVGGRPSH